MKITLHHHRTVTGAIAGTCLGCDKTVINDKEAFERWFSESSENRETGIR